ncbi:T6SS effector BTH_I2691 family protein [Photorhabdus akhurstii]|uniref:T6SS effector BTH_I2691 family protein n=1 Tax=Photorhabdus akhurstii TaxID=171438 RepID=UPI001BD328F2|nr:T6SS effector BTH_I2691 family protein [Photorhabdus akhurstii]MBS9428816.1 hypothetical protein [Photorhabdus akhurstii]
MDRLSCQMCEVTGPALLPVRYSVVPDRVGETLPMWAETLTPSAQGYHYALRALRQGFLYVYYTNSGPLVQYCWETWSVSEDGALWKQPNAFSVFGKKTADCYAPTHQSTNVEFIVLRDMALRQDVWLAFSPSVWSQETIQYYHNHPEARQKRMQCVKPWQWRGVPEGVGISQATVDNLNTVMDYHKEDDSAAKYILPYNPKVRRISRTSEKAPYYTFDPNTVGPQGTLYPWSEKRSGNAEATVKAMQKRGSAADDSSVSPVLIALHDPIGIVHELAGWSDDIAGEHSAWLDDLSIEFMTQQSLNGAKNQIQQVEKARVEQQTLDAYKSTANYGMDKVLVKIPSVAMSQRQSTLDALMVKAKQVAEQDGEIALATSWNKYEAELNLAKRQAFSDCYDKFCHTIASQLESLAEFRVSWLKEERLITHCHDFYSTQVSDNLSYREVVDYAMASLNVTDSGSAFLDELIGQYSAKPEGNFVWRSLLLNNPEVMAETEALLYKMKASKNNTLPAAESDYLSVVQKCFGKLVDAYDKANEALEAPISSNSSFSRAMLACDRRLSTIGQRVFRLSGLDSALNSLNILLNKTIFSVASGVPLDRIQELCLADIQSGNSCRQAISRGLQTYKSSKDLEKLNNYKQQFDKFAQSAEGEKTLRASRIKILVLFFNGMEFADQLKESKGDVKGYAQVTSAFLSTLSTVADVIKPAIEFGIKNQAATKSIKFVGASAGAVASVLNLGIDGSDVVREWRKEDTRWSFFGLSLLKSSADVGLLVKSMSGLLEVLVKREFSNKIIELAFDQIGKIAAWRIIGFFASWQFMIIIFVLDELYTLFIDNDLQDWCRNSVFGKEPDKYLVSTILIETQDKRNELYQKQSEKLGEALGAVL